MLARSLNDVIAMSEQTSGATDKITDFIKAWLRQHHKGIQDSARTIQLSVAGDYLWPLLQVISKQTQLSSAWHRMGKKIAQTARELAQSDYLQSLAA